MRTIERSSQFRRDFRREKRGRHGATIEHELRVLVALLAADESLPERYQDHALLGYWAGCRDCHLKPDLILVYQKLEPAILSLRRLGSHSELF